MVERSRGLPAAIGGEIAVLQAPMFDAFSLDPFSLFDDGRGSTEVGIGGRHVVQTLVSAGGCSARRTPRSGPRGRRQEVVSGYGSDNYSYLGKSGR